MSGSGPTFTRRELFVLLGTAGTSACVDLTPAPQSRPAGRESRVSTVCGVCPAGCGIAVRRIGADAVSIEGTPDHLVNRGGLCPRGLAEIQNLHHPARVRGPIESVEREPATRRPISWEAAFERVAAKTHGVPMVLGVGPVPAAERLLVEWIAAGSGAVLVPVRAPGGELPGDAFRSVLGSAAFAWDLTRSGLVVSLDWDWLQTSTSPVEMQRAHAVGRNGHRGRRIAVEPRLSTTAAAADLWIPVPPGGGAELFALGVANALLALGGLAVERRHPAFAALAREAVFRPAAVAARIGLPEAALERVAVELLETERPLVVADDSRPALGLAAVGLSVLCGALGPEGGIVPVRPILSPRFDPPSPPTRSLEFPEASAPPAVLLYAANPAYLCPPDTGWSAGLSRAPFVASVSSFEDESAALADLVLPLSTPLESPQVAWGTTLDGSPVASAGRAAVTALHDTLDGVTLLIRLAGALGVKLPWADAAAYRKALKEQLGLPDAGGARRIELAGGPKPSPRDLPAEAAAILRGLAQSDTPVGGEYPLLLRIHVPLAFPGGSGAHLPYLHGLSGPEGRELWLTRVEIHPLAAAAAGVAEGDRVFVESARGRIPATARVREGIHPRAAAIALGLGRRALGAWAEGWGANPLELVDADPHATPVRVRRA